jgi:quinol monooxygenase YgiN
MCMTTHTCKLTTLPAESRTELMIIESVGIVASPQRRKEVRRGLASLVEPTQVRPGCLSCQLYQNSIDPNEFRFESQWQTMDDFNLHACSDLYRTLLEILEMSARTPAITFYEVSATHGLELVQIAREHDVEISRRQSTT